MDHKKISEARSCSQGVVASVTWLTGETSTGVDDRQLFNPRMRDRWSREKSE